MAVFHGSIRSTTLGMDTGLSLFLPYDQPAENQHHPAKVLYLLHGLGNNHMSWLNNTSVARYAKEAGVALIMPEVQKSFYKDMFFGEAYFSYITKELPTLVSKLFNLSSKREDTFIAGLSMGGYGALKCALTYPQQYGGAGSFSGVMGLDYVVSVVESKEDERRLQGVLGPDYAVSPQDELVHLVESTPVDNLPKLFITCGTRDFLYSENIMFKARLEEMGSPFTYEEWDGEHEWGFWDQSVQKLFTTFRL